MLESRRGATTTEGRSGTTAKGKRTSRQIGYYQGCDRWQVLAPSAGGVSHQKRALNNASVDCSLEGNHPGRLPGRFGDARNPVCKRWVYQFFNVPSTVFDEFMSAPSKEGYYHEKIGERFPCS